MSAFRQFHRSLHDLFHISVLPHTTDKLTLRLPCPCPEYFGGRQANNKVNLPPPPPPPIFGKEWLQQRGPFPS